MNTRFKQAAPCLLSYVLTIFIFSWSTWLAIAQEKQPSSSSNKTGICEECCNTCRKSFYSDCSLSPVMTDSFGILNYETEMARLDNFAQTINNSPESDAYVVIYGGSTNKFGELEQRLNRIKKYLIDFKKLDPSRIIFVKGGFREKLIFELWISPVKNSYPPLSPTVDAENVVFRGKMKPLITSY